MRFFIPYKGKKGVTIIDTTIINTDKKWAFSNSYIRDSIIYGYNGGAKPGGLPRRF